jgi:hypothetical protein
VVRRAVRMSLVTGFGAFAVTAMLVFYALEGRAPAFVWPSRVRALLPRSTASCTVLGPAGSCNLSGPELPFAGCGYDSAVANPIWGYGLVTVG